MSVKTHRVFVLAAVLAAGLSSSLALAGGGPENVLVVVNSASWASRRVANEFIHLRQIPPRNVIELDWTADFENATIDVLREQILTPIFRTVAERGLSPQIDYVVYSSDLPHTINFAGDFKDKTPAQAVGNHGALTGLTYLAMPVLARDNRYSTLATNLYARRPGRAMGGETDTAWTAPEADLLRQAMQHLKEKKHADALPLFQKLADAHPENVVMQYNVACCLALDGKIEPAMAALTRAVDAGWWNWRHVLEDTDLQPLREREDFQALIERMKAMSPRMTVQPTAGFRSVYAWDTTGARVAGGQGMRYLLSTMLAVTSGRGNSVEEALACLRRAHAADGTKPAGTVYYMVNGDVRSKTRAWGFDAAVEMLQALGVQAEIAQGALPKDRPDVAGLMAGIAGFNWPASKSTILPGAICEHLTSFGGILRYNADQTPLSEFIRHGAAGAAGTVQEPLAIQAKFPLPFLHVHYARGSSLAEAFYQSVQGPYQLLIVGDPLCRPWATIPTVRFQKTAPGDVLRGTVTLSPLAAVEGGQISHLELFVDGARRGVYRPGQAIPLDTTTLADGWHELAAVAVAADPVETQGRTVVPIVVNNRGRRLTVDAPAAREFTWDTPLTLSARCEGAAAIRFLHNGRTVGEIPGAEGTARIDLRTLGSGPVYLHPIALFPPPPPAPGATTAPAAASGRAQALADTLVTAEPLRIEVTAPAPLPALPAPPDPKALAPFAQIVRADGTPVAFEKVPRTWLRDAGVQAGEAYTVRGLLRVDEPGVHQFQVKEPSDVTIRVGSATLSLPQRSGWAFLPVALEAGWHEVTVSATAAKGAPAPDIRFGGPGTRPLVEILRHAATEGETLIEAPKK